MPNNDYILRSDALNALSRGSGCENICSNAIKRIPAADVESKRKTGRWIDVYVTNPARMRTKCSECGLFSGIGGIPRNRHKPYCPNCGSPMLTEPPKEVSE